MQRPLRSVVFTNACRYARGHRPRAGGRSQTREFEGTSMTVWHEWMSALFGTRMSTHVLGTVTWADVALSGAVVVLIMVAHAAAVIIIRRKRESAAPEAKLRHHTLGALRGPLYLLIWICGGYFALAPLLASSPLGSRLVLGLLRTLLNLGIFAVAFWFCFRFTRVLEARLS